VREPCEGGEKIHRLFGGEGEIPPTCSVAKIVDASNAEG
jgi:hypothetical protein